MKPRRYDLPSPRLCLAFVGLLLLLGAGGAAQASPVDRDRIPPGGQEVTRHYATVDGLQVHYRAAKPAPGRGRAPTVFALHQSPNSSQVYVEFMALLARDRRVIAPDTPGFGQSDAPERQPAIADYARIMDGLAEQLGESEVDLVGYHTGAATAVEWALANPARVRRLWLVGVPAFNADERARLGASPWPNPAPLDAERVAAEWEGSKSWQGPGQSDASVERTFLAKLASGRTGWWGAAAVFDHDLLARLALVRQPVGVARPRDDLWDITSRVREVRPGLEVVDLPAFGFAVFEVAPERMAELAREEFPGAGVK